MEVATFLHVAFSRSFECAADACGCCCSVDLNHAWTMRDVRLAANAVLAMGPCMQQWPALPFDVPVCPLTMEFAHVSRRPHPLWRPVSRRRRRWLLGRAWAGQQLHFTRGHASDEVKTGRDSRSPLSPRSRPKLLQRPRDSPHLAVKQVLARERLMALPDLVASAERPSRFGVKRRKHPASSPRLVAVRDRGARTAPGWKSG